MRDRGRQPEQHPEHHPETHTSDRRPGRVRRATALALATLAASAGAVGSALPAAADQPPRPNPNTYVFEFENNNTGMVARFCVRNSDMSVPETDCTENVPSYGSASRTTGTAPRGVEAYPIAGNRTERIDVDFAKCVDQFCTFEVVGTTNSNFVLQQR